MNTLTHKGLRRHVIGNAKKPVVPVLREDGEYYLPNGKDALKDDELEKLQETEDDFLKKEASVREVLYETISQTTFMQVKNEPTSAKCWTALTSIFEDKGELTKLDTLTKLQTMLCLETDDVRKHLSRMSELREELAGMGSPMTDAEFSTNIRRSLPPSY